MTQLQPAGPAVIWCSFPDAACAETISVQLLDERLVACANILGPMRSLFTWQGERSVAEETGVLFKTDAALINTAVARLGELHPYETPVIIALRGEGHPATAAWLAGLVR